MQKKARKVSQAVCDFADEIENWVIDNDDLVQDVQDESYRRLRIDPDACLTEQQEDRMAAMFDKIIGEVYRELGRRYK